MKVTTAAPESKANILVVEDEKSVSDLLVDIMEQEGHTVRVAADGLEGLQLFYSWKPSLAVLDVLMPRMDGWTLLDRIREVSEVPVIMLTALGREEDTVRGLRSGADDYVVKPVRLAEFVARVEAVLRKKGVSQEVHEIYEDAALHVDFPRHQVNLWGREVELSPREFRLLAALVKNPGMVLSVDRLLDLCWGEGEGGPENVRVYIGYLRKKLEEDTRKPQLIETVREFGYRYRPPTRG